MEPLAFQDSELEFLPLMNNCFQSVDGPLYVTARNSLSLEPLPQTSCFILTRQQQVHCPEVLVHAGKEGYK